MADLSLASGFWGTRNVVEMGELEGVGNSYALGVRGQVSLWEM